MTSLKNLSVRTKLFLLISIPLLGLIYFSALKLVQASAVVDNAAKIEQLVKIASANAALVHEIQKERGASAGFIDSNGEKFGSILADQWEETGRALIERQRLLDEYLEELEEPEIQQKTQQVNRWLEDLEEVRSRVSDLAIPMSDAVAYYTQNNTLLLDIAPQAAKLSTDAKVSQMIQAYYNFLQGKERAGIERAVLSSAFSVDRFKPGVFSKFVALVSEQTAYLSTFESFSGTDQANFYRDAMAHDAVKEVQRFRDKAIEYAEFGSFNEDPTSWFKAATGRINQLKRVENKLSADILQFSAQQREAASTAFTLQIVLSLVIIALTLAAAYWIVSLITAQVSNLTTTVTHSAQHKDLSLRADIYSHDELGKTATSLNEMLESFSGALDEIGKASVQLASAAEETSTTVEESGQSLEEQRQQTELVVTATDEMNSTSQEVARSINEAAEAANRTRVTANEGAQVVRHNVDRIQRLAHEVQDVGNIIEELHAGNADIVNVIAVIKSVAEQTNLLALNAAIEAARAGEQGRGFAVVADEVRTLAQRTQSSTSEIEAIISNFNALSERAFEAIKASSEMAVDTASQTGGLEQALDNISNDITSISDMATQVAAAAEQQVATTGEIARNIETISAMTQTTASGMTQISAVAQEQARMANNLQAISTAFRT